jgi:NADH pyrophosphatase NudC (nudix superfamily)
MLGYLAFAQKSDFEMSCEVDQINWFSIKDAILNIREGSIASELLKKAPENLQDLSMK